jgi:anhydro-N-acetylmuramic acid kinase
MVVGVFARWPLRRVSAALLRIEGTGLDACAEVVDHSGDSLPEEICTRFVQLADGGAAPPGSAALLAAEVAECAGGIVKRLSQDRTARGAAVLAGVLEPGLWYLEGRKRAYQSVFSAERFAETTGYSVVDHFPSRDLVCGGLGGPLTALPHWMLLRHPVRTRVLLDLGRTVRLTYLPAGGWGTFPSRVVAFDVGPGMSLLDRLSATLTGGVHAFDPGGRHAVQGRRIAGLVEHWLDDPYFKRLPPRWHPLGCRHERELASTIKMAVDTGWSVRDLLCTGCHFIAETVARAVTQRLGHAPGVDELVLTGGGQHNGMILREIAARLPEIRMVRVAELGIDDDALEPACAALLAQLHTAQAPANHPAITGTEAPRVLGRLTPGSPQNWQKLARELAASRPPLMPLRSAV